MKTGWLAFLLMSLLLGALPIQRSLFAPEAEAVPAAVAAPGVAIGALESASAAAAAAAYLGVITRAQSSKIQATLSDEIKEIRRQAAQAADRAISDITRLYQKVANSVEGRTCSTNDHRAGNGCTANIEECCRDFLNRMGNRAQMSHGALKILKSESGKPKLLCCMEWDSLHGGLEIFDPWGRHLGERSCDDLNDDPCAWTSARGKHAEPNTETHKPRTRTCRP